MPVIWFINTPGLAELAADPAALTLSTSLAEAGAFFSTGDHPTVPDMQLHAGAVAFGDTIVPPGRPCSTTMASLLEPRSRGSVRLRSADPMLRPAIDLGFYTHTGDLEDLVVGLRMTIDMARSGPLAAYLDDRAAADHIGRWTQTMYHPVGTCATGIGADAVVDPELQVQGVDGLRVVDVSVMPRITHGNTNAPTVMIAEKAADLIRR